MSAPTDFVRMQKGLENDPIARLVLFAVSFYVNYTTGDCWPSIPTLSAESGCHQNTVRRKLHLLQKNGFIKLKERDGLSSIITLIGYKDWIDKVPVRKPTKYVEQDQLDIQDDCSPTTEVGVDPYHTSEQPLPHGCSTPTTQVGKIYNRNIINKYNKKNDNRITNCNTEVESRVYFHNEQIKLCDSLNQFWLEQFEGQQDCLDLALLQISAYVQPNNIHGIEKQVSSQLARIVRDRKDKDKRYAAAAKTKSFNGKPNHQASKSDDAIDRANAKFWARVEKGEIKV